MTTACEVSPRQWLFANQGQCCVSKGGDEAGILLLADWIGGLCNVSQQWREPFEFYGGMARLDWEEWIEPWNWTVRPENTTVRDDVPTPSCESSQKILGNFGLDNAISFVSAFVQIFIHWLRHYRDTDKGLSGSNAESRGKEPRPYSLMIIAGFTTALGYFLSNMFTAVYWSTQPGYSHMPIGLVGLLLYARPSILGFVSFVGLFARSIKSRPQGTTGLSSQESTKTAPRKWFDLSWRGRTKLKQLLAGTALSIGITEACGQVLSMGMIGVAANTGRIKGFYVDAATLTPFWRGEPARLMYEFAMVHMVFAPLSLMCLLVTAANHISLARHHQRSRQLEDARLIIMALKAWYKSVKDRTPPGREPTEAEKVKGRKMALEQKYLEDCLNFESPPTWWKKVWNWLTRKAKPETTDTPDESEFNRLEQRYNFAIMWNDLSPISHRGYIITLLLTFVCVSMNYASQWCFWTGFVESSGDRYETFFKDATTLFLVFISVPDEH
jgi:hypothetical protein